MSTHPGPSASETRRVLDVPSLALLVVGVVFGAWGLLLVVHQGLHPLIVGPSIIAATVGATHLFKREAPRDTTLP